jgi:putative ABC transport system permease protein
MNRGRLILRSLTWFRMTHLGVLLGVAVGAAVLTGALLIGESVRRSLREQAELRIGRTELVLATGERFFREELAELLAGEFAQPADDPTADRIPVAPVISLRGIASAGGGARRALDVAVLGIDARFFRLGPSGEAIAPPAEDEVFLNPRLARQLDAKVGDRVVLRVEPPSAMPREAVLGGGTEGTAALALRVARILEAEDFGHLDFTAAPLPPHNAFVSLDRAQTRFDLGEQVNLCLVGGTPAPSLEVAEAALHEKWNLEDAGLRVRELTASSDQELLCDRVFFDPVIAEALAELDRPAMGVFTYLAADFTLGERSAPYSLVAALGPLGAREASRDAPWRSILPAGMGEAELVINRWLAEDLEAEVGDELTMRFPLLDSDGELVEETRRLRIRAIVPIEGLAADRELMPRFPGIAGSESCSDWEPGLPIDLERIRDRDEEWWDERGGTPKAFVTLDAGRAMWGSERFGTMTAVRFAPSETDPFAEALRAALDPTDLGLSWRDVRTPALAASSPATDFGGLFLGLSFFLFGAAFLLVGLLFALGILQRSSEVGTLLALGFPGKSITRILVIEAALLAAIGAALGAALAPGHARLVILALRSIWSDAVASAPLEFHSGVPSLLDGGAIAFAVAVIAAWITLRRRVKVPAVELLGRRGGVESDDPDRVRRSRRRSGAGGIVGAVGALAATTWALLGSAPTRPAASFLAGTLALIAALALCRFALLIRREETPFRSLGALAWSNASRRSSRSLATIALLACGAFLVIVVGAHRKGAPEDSSVRASGTGGFALLGRSSLAIVPDLAQGTGDAGFLFGEERPAGVSLVPLRVREGDDASCLNLHRPQEPRLLGVRPELLAERGAFRFAESLSESGESPWSLLGDVAGSGPVPAIGDQASLLWSLHVGVGDTLPFVDERGREFEVRIVGSLAGSILQGNLLIGDAHFQERFPSETGYRMFLVDAPLAGAPTLAEEWMRRNEDFGLELISTGARLEELATVQNTYLLVFQMLGGLGLLLGSVGLGVVVLRNVCERRGELAVLAAVGFPASRIRRVLLFEHAILLLAGLACGTLGALVAVLAMLPSIPGGFPLTPVLLLLASMLGAGLFGVWLASHLALRAPLLDALARG